MSELHFGDKVLVTYKNGDQFVGRIKDSTDKTYTIEFDDGDLRRIRKTMNIKLIDDPETPEIEKSTGDEEFWQAKVPTKRKPVWPWIVAFLVLATALTVLGLFVL